jgi:hypothetical protein
MGHFLSLSRFSIMRETHSHGVARAVSISYIPVLPKPLFLCHREQMKRALASRAPKVNSLYE